MSTPGSSPFLLHPRLSLTLTLALALATGGCSDVFDDAQAYSEMFASEASEGSAPDPAPDDDDHPGVHTSTTGAGAEPEESQSDASASTGEPDPDDETTSAAEPLEDKPPVVQQPAVEGSKTPDPITAAGPVALSVVAHDDDYVERVEFLVNDEPIATIYDHEGGLYTHTLTIEHQDDAGDYELQAIAFDGAGQSTASPTIAFTVELPESGKQVVFGGNKPLPGEHIHWEDVALSPSGEFFVVGRRIKDGVVSLLCERRGPDGALIDGAWIPQTVDRYGVAAAFMDGTLIVVSRDVDGSSRISRHFYNGTLMHQHSQDDVEWRDVAVGDDLVYVVGNTGALGGFSFSSARTWAMTPALQPYWVRTETGGGVKNAAHAVEVADGRVFTVGHISYEGNTDRFGAVWAYTPADGDSLWSHPFETKDEELRALTILPDGLRAVGVREVDSGQRMIMYRLLEDGAAFPVEILEPTSEVERAYAIAASSHGEYMVAGTSCTDGECFAQVRRYAGDTHKWTSTFGMKSPITRFVAAESLPYGYVVVVGQHAINYGNGDQGTSWFSVLHP